MKRLLHGWCLLAIVSLALSTGGCRRPAEPWNVLLVTFDTTRADRIGCYGNERIETPTLDALAAEGVRFSRAVSAVPITAPSHSTILTGRYPMAHGVRDNGLFVLGDEQVTLAEILADHGYATGAAVGAYPVIARFGLDQGFDFYDDHLTGSFEDYLGQRVVPKQRLFFDERRAAQVNEAILPWLDENAQRPFFAWVHYFDPHQPFEPAPPFDQLYAHDLYDGEIAYTDSRLGFLLDHLERLGVLDRTLVVMTADHGEGLGEHGEMTHAILAYDSTLHVPLIVRPPAGAAPAGRVVEDWVGTVDIVPTVLDLLGLPSPDGVQGRSLVPLWQGDEGDSPAPTSYYAENLSPRLTHGWGELRVLFDPPLKYIHGPRPELYDLEADPRELGDLAAERPQVADELRTRLQDFLDRHAIDGVSQTQELDPEVRQRLEALGYLQTGAGGVETIVETLNDEGIPPRERVGDLNDLSSAKHLLFAGRHAEALAYTRRLVATDPGSPLYLELHATALSELGRLDEAWQVMERLGAEHAPPEELTLRLIALRFQTASEPAIRREVVESLRSHLSRSPAARGEWLLASLHQRLGEPESARTALERALAEDPDFVPARVDLAIRVAEAGDPEAAEREFLSALETAPYYAKAHYNYGTFLLQSGRSPEAIARFRRTVELAPGYLRGRLALVAAHLAAGEVDDAEAAYRELERLAPRSEEAALAAGLLSEP